MSSSNVSHYKEKGYECKCKDIISVDVNDLMNQSTIKIIAICDVCGEEKEIEYRKYINNKKNKDFYACSLSCAQSKIKLTKIENYGDPNFSNIEKRNETCIERYGDKNYKNFDKIKQTNLDKYGFECSIKNDDVKEKRKLTYIKKYGVDSPIKNSDVKQKRNKTMLERYGVENYNNVNKALSTIKESNMQKLKENFCVDVIDYNDRLFTINCDKGHEYKVSYDILTKRYQHNSDICTVCNPIGSKFSGDEKKLSDFINENYKGEIILNNRNIIKPYELDIYIPELNIAIEYNGLFWHSELYKKKNYHKMKFDMCKNINIQLIQIYEDDWRNKTNIVKSILLNKLGKNENKIFARKCVVKELTNNIIVKNFLDNNHIQGYAVSSVKIGLYYNDDLVSLMTFIKKNNNNYELNRFCNVLNTSVVGGASKLFNFFTNNYKYNKIISFSNNSYSNGNIYEKLKFNKISELKEDYSYIVNGIRVHKFNFRKKENQIETEREFMLNNNNLRIYDSGKIKFIYPL